MEEWHEEDLYQIGDLLITLSRNDLLSIPLTSFRKAVPYLIEKSRFHDKYDVHPSYSNNTVFYKVLGSERNHEWGSVRDE